MTSELFIPALVIPARVCQKDRRTAVRYNDAGPHMDLEGEFQIQCRTRRTSDRGTGRPSHWYLRKNKIMSSIEDQVRNIVAEQLGVKEEEVTAEASFVDDLGADSLDTVELVMALEEAFECEIPDEEAEKITTVQLAIDYIKARGGDS